MASDHKKMGHVREAFEASDELRRRTGSCRATGSLARPQHRVVGRGKSFAVRQRARCVCWIGNDR